MKNIVIFHYHFLPGGVTSVIKNQIYLIKKIFPDINIILVSSNPKKNSIEDNYTKLYYPELDYITNIQIDKNTIEQKIENIFYDLHKKYKNSIWWIHNHHLGKNPIFTQVLTKFLQTTDQKTILQIHDFPECARLENYQTLLNFYPDIKLYPIKKHILYSIINKNDYDILYKSGIPKNKLIYLPNIYIKKELNNINLLHELEELSSKYNFNFNKKFPTVLYPVRSIRRKNILEAILFNKILQNFNLIVTLPANSKSEMNYSNLVKRLFIKEKIIGAWGIAFQNNKIFDFLLQHSKMLLSTSVLEGFGLFIFDAISAQKNFYARYLPIFKDFKITNKQIFYHNFYIKIDKLILKKLKQDYIKQIDSFDFLKDFKNELMTEIHNNFMDQYIDFSYLDVYTQSYIIEHLDNKSIDEIKEINTLFNDFENILNQRDVLNLKIYYEKGNKSFIKFISHIDDYFNSQIDNYNNINVEKNILKHNLSLKNLRLLFKKY